MSMFSNFMKSIGAYDVPGAQAISDALSAAGHPLAGAADRLVNWTKKHGPEVAIAGLLGGPLLGAGLAGADAVGSLFNSGIFRRPPKVRPTAKTSAQYTCGYDKTTGQPLDGKEQWSFAGRVQLAAGAQAINTDLADFLNSASSSDLSATGTFGFDWAAESIKAVISANLAASYVETLAVLAGLKIFERIYSSKEEAQFDLLDIATYYSITGVVTSGAAAAAVPLGAEGVEWQAGYMAQVVYAFVLRTVRAFTSVGAIDSTLTMKGFR